MGSKLVLEKASDANTKNLNSQALQIDHIFTKMVDEMKEHLEEAITTSNIQKNNTDVDKDFKKLSIRKHCRDEFSTGFVTSEHLIKQLKDSCK